MRAVFFPRNDYPNNIEVCYHRLGKKMTYTEQTTTPNWWSIKYLLPSALQLGIKSSWAPNPRYSYAPVDDYYLSLDRAGLIYSDFYSYVPHTEQDPITDEKALNVLLNPTNGLRPWFIETFGRKPIGTVYSQGITSYSDAYKPYLLSGKDNAYNHNSNYGLGCGSPNNIPFNHTDYMAYTASFRVQSEASIVYPNMENINTVIQMVAGMIDDTLALPNGGWLYNFSHWHDVVANDIDTETDTPKEGHENLPTINAYIDYLEMLAQKNANDEIYFAGYGEAIAYLVYRESISKVVMYSPIGSENDKLVIRLEALNVFNIDTDLLQIPISIKFSTTGTPLVNQTIRCNYNLISLGNNQYIVEIPYAEYPGAVIEKVSI